MSDVAVSVVLCTRNGAGVLSESVGAVLAQAWDQPWELVVVDNDSDDDTPAVLDRLVGDVPHARVVRATARRSVAHARNVGIEAAAGRSVVFADDDDVVAPGWLEALGRALAVHPVVAVHVEVDEINPPAVAATRRPAQITGVGTFRGVPVVSSHMGVRREWARQVGGFDESIPGPAGEDTDFALRLWGHFGTEPVFVADAVCHYRLRGEPRTLVRQGFRYGRVHPLLHARWDALCPEPAPSVSLGLKEWGALVRDAPGAVRRRHRDLRWFFRLGVKAGHVAGSVRYGRLVL